MPPGEPLRLVNLQSEVTAPFLAAVAAWLSAHAGFPVAFYDDGDWTDRREALMRGEAALGLWCGLPYALEAESPAPRVVAIAAPVMAAPRYEDTPVYFSDVIVRREAPFHCLEDLRGASWTYNEPSSHSGYWVTRYELARRGLPAPFFGRVIEAGSHMTSIELVRSGRIEASAIDSTVLELAQEADPSLADDLRVIDTWGPSAMPPLVASTRLPVAQREALTEALIAMRHDPAGRAALAIGLVSRFAPVTAAVFDPLRRMAAIGAGYPLGEAGGATLLTEEGTGVRG
jgi:phosphonate transport system substrate-binding protein